MKAFYGTQHPMGETFPGTVLFEGMVHPILKESVDAHA